MALDVWFQEDIAQTIVSVTVGMLTSAAAHGATNLEYCRGVLDTARAQALSYRIPWLTLKAELQAALADVGHDGLLDMLAEGMPIAVRRAKVGEERIFGGHE
jgi:hypothetical protein